MKHGKDVNNYVKLIVLIVNCIRGLKESERRIAVAIGCCKQALRQ
jgi:hypothetical protein